MKKRLDKNKIEKLIGGKDAPKDPPPPVYPKPNNIFLFK